MIVKKQNSSMRKKVRKEIEYTKDIYRYRIQCEIDNYIDNEEKPDSVQAQDVLYLDKVFIWLEFVNNNE